MHLCLLSPPLPTLPIRSPSPRATCKMSSAPCAAAGGIMQMSTSRNSFRCSAVLKRGGCFPSPPSYLCRMNRKGLYGYDISRCSGMSARLGETKLKGRATLYGLLGGSRPKQHQPHSPCGRGRGDDDGGRFVFRSHMSALKEEEEKKCGYVHAL